jgi:hypothetical protein
MILGLCINGGVTGAIRAEIQAKNFDMESVADVIMEAITTNDPEIIKSMMSKKMLANGDTLDTELSKLMTFIKGNLMSYEYFDAGGETLNRIEKGRIERRILKNGRIDFNTTDGIYRLSFYYEVANTYSPENEGMWSLTIYEQGKGELGAHIEAKPEKFFD